MTTRFVASLLLAYLLGAIPFAYLIARGVRGIDIRTVGDGNPGGKNVFEQIGPLAGIAVTLLDIGKGALALVFACMLTLSGIALLWIGLAAIVGHNWSVFLHFQGGQGMATTVGVLLMLLPIETVVAISMIATMLWFTHHWDLACGVGFVTLPILSWWWQRPPELTLYVVAILPLIGLRKWIQRVSATQGDVRLIGTNHIARRT